jgi:hypothetical protein
VIAFADAINAGVHLRAARQCDGYLFAEEEIGIFPQFFGRIDRIVIGDGDKVHASPFQNFIEGEGFVVGLKAYAREPGNSAVSGVNGMNVEVAPHDSVIGLSRYNAMRFVQHNNESSCFE